MTTDDWVVCMTFIVLGSGYPRPDAVSCQEQLSYTCPRCPGRDLSLPVFTHGALLRFANLAAMPDTSPLGSLASKTALNHQRLDMKSPDWGENRK